MPTTKVFGQLASLAIAGKTKIDGGLTGGAGEATTRVEFVAVDLNGDGNETDPDEGFMRVWSSQGKPSSELAVEAARYNAAAFDQFSSGGAIRAAISSWAPRPNENCGCYRFRHQVHPAKRASRMMDARRDSRSRMPSRIAISAAIRD